MPTQDDRIHKKVGLLSDVQVNSRKPHLQALVCFTKQLASLVLRVLQGWLHSNVGHMSVSSATTSQTSNGKGEHQAPSDRNEASAHYALPRHEIGATRPVTGNKHSHNSKQQLLTNSIAKLKLDQRLMTQSLSPRIVGRCIQSQASRQSAVQLVRFGCLFQSIHPRTQGAGMFNWPIDGYSL